MIDPAWLTVLQAASRASVPAWRKALASSGSVAALSRESRGGLSAAGIPETEITKHTAPDGALLERWQAWLAAPSRALVTDGDPAYPPLLREIAGAPLALWVEGADISLLNAPQLAIVGSRNPTANGREDAEQFARYLSRQGLTITSGLAVGIDGASHRGALREAGSTIAVLGSGLDVIYPREHEPLAREIAAAGLVVSEYGPGTPALAHHFPERNRIIAGLSLGTLVVEAARRSGSLITARFAGEFGREVFALPGSIHNPLARGCHELLRRGAKLVEEAGDILVELAPLLQLDLASMRAQQDERVQPRYDVDPMYEKLLKNMEFTPLPLAKLAERTGLTAAELSSMLLVLELEGLVAASPGGRYTRLRKSSS